MGKREKTKQETRKKLIEAGLALFARDGLDGPSLDAICEHAGFTRGAFYVHFKDRDDFLASVMEEAGGPILDTVLESSGEGLAGLLVGFAAAFEDGTYPLSPAGGIKPHQFFEACARNERVRSMYVELVNISIERVAAAIEYDQKQGSIVDVDPKTIATVLLAAVIGAQTMEEVGVDVDLLQSGLVVSQLLMSE